MSKNKHKTQQGTDCLDCLDCTDSKSSKDHAKDSCSNKNAQDCRD